MRFDSTSRWRRSRTAAALSGALIVVVALVTFAAFGSGSAVAQAEAVPVNTDQPAISGNPTVGSTLTGTDGTWSNSPTSFTRQWVRCASTGGAADGSDCATISGATTSTYVVDNAEVGFTLRLRVTASNSDGPQTAASNHTAVVSASSAPVNTAAPIVSGAAVQGQTLTGTNGTWSGGAPISYTYQWVQCGADGGSSDGSNCATITNATSATYTLQSSDVAVRIRLRVTAANSSGVQTAASDATAAVTATASGLPANTTQPAITGSALQGSQLTTSLGAWTGTAPITYAIQWVRCGTDGGNADGSNCTTITGATGATYFVQSQDVGTRLRTRVTATNTVGSSISAANATAVIQGSTAPPTSSTVVPIASVVAPDRLIIDRVQFTPNPIQSQQSTLQVRVHVMDTEGHGVSGALVFARTTPILTTTPAEQATGADGWVTLSMIPRPTFPLQTGHSVQVFVRARKAGEPLLAGVSNRRLVQVATTG